MTTLWNIVYLKRNLNNIYHTYWEIKARVYGVKLNMDAFKPQNCIIYIKYEAYTHIQFWIAKMLEIHTDVALVCFETGRFQYWHTENMILSNICINIHTYVNVFWQYDLCRFSYWLIVAVKLTTLFYPKQNRFVAQSVTVELIDSQRLRERYKVRVKISIWKILSSVFIWDIGFFQFFFCVCVNVGILCKSVQ